MNGGIEKEHCSGERERERWKRVDWLKNFGAEPKESAALLDYESDDSHHPLRFSP